MPDGRRRAHGGEREADRFHRHADGRGGGGDPGQEGTRTYYSTRYESAYCIYQPNAYQTATVWYQSQESQAAKLRLARLFGVTRYIVE